MGLPELAAGQLELFRLPPPGSATVPSRHLFLAGRRVDYRLRRDRRRLSMRIDERGLAVGAPHGLALADIEAFILEHGVWVLEKLDALAARTARRHLSLHDGAVLPVLGRAVRVRVTAGGNRGYWRRDETDGTADELWLAARPAADLSLIARCALQRYALEHCRPRLAHYAAQIDRPAPVLALSSAQGRWGSCSSSGIRLNWRLIHLPGELIDYVVAHEVAHLLEMNHSPRFWTVVARLFPEWRQARDELKRQGASLPMI